MTQLQTLIGLLNEKINERGYSYTIESDEECLEELREYAYGDTLMYRKPYEERRWWREYEYVVKIDDTYWMFIDATSDGDVSAQERGFRPDPKSIVQVEPVEEVVTITKYIPKD